MTCKHENADHLWPSDVLLVRDKFAGVALVEQFRCIDCGAWLSLGESDEHASEQVETEIRAAEIVARHVNKRGRLGLTGDLFEIDGWCAHVTDVDEHSSDVPTHGTEVE